MLRTNFFFFFFRRSIRWIVTFGNSGPTPDSLSMFHWQTFPSILRRWRGSGLLTLSSSTDRSPFFTKSQCPTNSSASTKTVPFYILKGKKTFQSTFQLLSQNLLICLVAEIENRFLLVYEKTKHNLEIWFSRQISRFDMV